MKAASRQLEADLAPRWDRKRRLGDGVPVVAHPRALVDELDRPGGRGIAVVRDLHHAREPAVDDRRARTQIGNAATSIAELDSCACALRSGQKRLAASRAVANGRRTAQLSATARSTASGRVGTAETRVSITRSAATPSASPSKLRISRWRSTGSATRCDVGERDVGAALEQRQRLGGEHERLPAAHARAEANGAFHQLRRGLVVRRARGDQARRVAQAPVRPPRSRGTSSRSPSTSSRGSTLAGAAAFDRPWSGAGCRSSRLRPGSRPAP